MPGVHLSKVGKREAKNFAKNYRYVKFDQIYVSPLERCSETISPYLAESSKKRRFTKPIIENLNFVEMDYGAWSGLKLQKLALKPLWRKIQNNPITVTFPEGESFRSLNLRIKKGLLEIARLHKNKNILVVTHGDVIKIATAIALNMDFNDFQKIAIDPASITAISIIGKKFRVLTVNSRAEPVAVDGQRFALGGGAGSKAKRRK
ncbi:hypothetical protein LBMAG09_02590 [Actinomycetes bacterium]|nr:hypothetical protein LBMAG09_02590 [Actinomycetes bacterium]